MKYLHISKTFTTNANGTVFFNPGSTFIYPDTNQCANDRRARRQGLISARQQRIAYKMRRTEGKHEALVQAELSAWHAEKEFEFPVCEI